jgi:uncharacterized damage-inducible protein DinB
MPGPRVGDVLVALHGAFEGKGWHGPTVLQALAGVTAREAIQKPAAFAASLRAMKATHRRLVEAVSALDDAALDRSIGTWDSGRMPLARVLHGVAAHDAYHAGQIRLVRTLL